MTEKTFPAEVLESIQTAREIASTDFVNMKAGTDWLCVVQPEAFPDAESAEKAIRGETAIPPQG